MEELVWLIRPEASPQTRPSGGTEREPPAEHQNSTDDTSYYQYAWPSPSPVDVEEDEDDMEDMIADDAVWKRIQQNTFTRWANEHLKTVGEELWNLETDLGDGLKLISLLQVLSGKRLPKHNKKPSFRSQKLENVSVALNFLEKDEGIKIVNIDSSDIVDCKLKLILGLIWHLILHYSISMPVWEGEEGSGEKDKKGPTPKQRLLNWVQNKIPELPLGNFTTDWNDGRAVGALVDSVAPGLCPDWQDWKKEEALQNASEAMGLADDFLDVRQLIKPEELVNPSMDELSMMTYLSQYPSAKLKPGAPLRPKTNLSSIRCSGPGVEKTGLRVNTPALFTVETSGCGKGDLDVRVHDSTGEKIPVELKTTKEGTYAVSYRPTLDGPHKVFVLFGTPGRLRQVPGSPFGVSVEGQPSDPTKVEVSGPGLEPSGVLLGKQTYLDIFTQNAGKGVPEVMMLDPNGKVLEKAVKVRELRDGVWRCEYTPTQPGLHSLNIFWNRVQVPGSPFPINVLPLCDPRRVLATGRGLQPKGVRVGDKTASFKIRTEGAGEGELDVRMVGPGGSSVPVRVKPGEGGVFEAHYEPVKEGRHVIVITYGGHEVPKSPFQVEVGPRRKTGVKVFGPGLSTGIVNHPAAFVVDTNGERGALGFQIEGPSQSTIECVDNLDGSANVSYLPTAAGEYYVHILCDEEDIEESPFVATIHPSSALQPQLLTCSGPGIESTQPLLVGRRADFSVDTRAGGDGGVLDVQVFDAEGRPVPVQVVVKPDGRHSCSYTPTKAGKHTVQVSYGGVLSGNPYRVNVVEVANAAAVVLNGPGLESGLVSGTPTHFLVDASKAGEAELELSILDSRKNAVPYMLSQNPDNTYRVDYEPRAGEQHVGVLYGGLNVPGSPKKISILPHVDFSKVRVKGLEPSVFVDSPTEFDVEGVPDGTKLLCVVRSPSGLSTPTPGRQMPNGAYRFCYTPVEEGAYDIELSYDSLSLPVSPYRVDVAKGADPSKVKAYGLGLERATVNEPNLFTIETRGAGSSGLNLAIEGASEAKMTCKDNMDGSCTVEYIPTAVGIYDITIKFGDTDVPGSPFKVPVVHSFPNDKVRASGDGLDANKVRAGIKQTFIIDAAEAGPGPMACSIKGLNEVPLVVDRGDGTFEVSYTPQVPGAHLSISAKYNGLDIVNTPVELDVRPRAEADRVKLSGDCLGSKGVPASLPTTFIVDTREAGEGELRVEVKGPHGSPRKLKLSPVPDGTFAATFTPDVVGEYEVLVEYGGEGVKAPRVKAYPVGKASACRITEGRVENLNTGVEQCVSVDCARAGDGAVTARILRINGKGEEVEVEVERNVDGTSSVYYKVKEDGEYGMNLFYGGQPLPNGQYTFQATDSTVSSTTTTNRTRTRTRTTEETNYSYPPLQLDRIQLPPSAKGGSVKLTAEIVMPSGERDAPELTENPDGTVSVKYEPRVEGLHELRVNCNGHSIEGSPFAFYVDSLLNGTATAYGPGLTHGVSGEPCHFTISTNGAAAGGLELAVEGPSKADITCHDNKDGTVSVSFLPTSPGEYKVSAKLGGKDLKGSPYTCKVTGEGRQRSHVSVGSCSEVAFPGQVSEGDLRTLNAVIHSPSGLEEPCFLKRLPNGNIGISFTPRETGEHEVSVKKRGTHISNSPFKIVVGESEVGDARKVEVKGAALKHGTTHTDNTFNVNTRDAGYGGLSLSIEGPSKAEIKCEDQADGSLDISYKPTEPGVYIINLKFADHHVPSSPFIVKVDGEGSNKQRERIMSQREAVPVTQVGSECRLTFKMPGVKTSELSSTVTSPSGQTEDAAIKEVEDGYAVHFVPKELGVHTVSVKFNGVHIPGSPFSFTVGPLRDGGAHRVRAGGSGLERGEVSVPAEFNVWTREAGAGSLAISVEGPSRAEIDFKERKESAGGSCYVSYIVSEPGDYRVGIRFNDEEIPDSPFRVYISPNTGEARKVDVPHLPEGPLQPQQPNVLLVRKNGAEGQLDAKLVSPSGAQDDCFIDTVDQDTYSVRFMPRENGLHLLHIKLKNVHIPGSPFRLQVGDAAADPASVHAHGKGLETLKAGQKAEFFIDTSKAGAGHLAVTIDGPSKVSMDCAEVDDGYQVHFTPLTAGVYFVGVKYNGSHIPGSPFKVNCTGSDLSGKTVVTQETSSVVVETVQKTTKYRPTTAFPVFVSNAQKVTSNGMGLKRAYLQKQNQFSINASEAGNNILYVGMMGPKGPCEEVFIKHLGHHNYTINYLCRDKGDYLIICKWGEDHIPGSPFRVQV